MSDHFPWQEHLESALKKWNRPDANDTLFAATALWRQIAVQAPTGRSYQSILLQQALEKLRAQDEVIAQLVELRFSQGQKIATLATKLGYAESTIYKHQEQAVCQMVQILQEMEQEARQSELTQLRLRLPPASGHSLIAINSQVEALSTLLSKPGPPWLFCMEGIGGIGKTTLADTLARHLLDTGKLVGFAWVSARQHYFTLGGFVREEPKPSLSSERLIDALAAQLFPSQIATESISQERLLTRLEAHLHRIPHLIVIDNLETVVDVDTLLPLLRRFQHPTKFLLTSRKRIDEAGDVYHFPVQELSQADALLLVRQEARTRNISQLVNATDAELLPIYKTVGGNPLALRLIVGQTHIHALDVILDDLASARGSSIGALYDYIYRRAWDYLDAVSRKALLAMPLVTEQGGTLAYLAQISRLDASDLRDALQNLVSLNLVDSRGDLHERRYTIHALTRTFLQTHVIKWQSMVPNQQLN